MRHEIHPPRKVRVTDVVTSYELGTDRGILFAEDERTNTYVIGIGGHVREFERSEFEYADE